MLKTLENDILRLTVDTHGAEIHSLVAKDTGIEYIWQADPNYWQRHAPILFPIVGKLKNGQYEYDGTVYRMPGHGFARDKEFEFSGQTENSLEYTLTYDEDTLRMYPFKFKLTVTYTINFAEVKVSWKVENLDTKEKVYVLRDYDTGIITDVTTDYYKAVNAETAQRNISEILYNNGY